MLLSQSLQVVSIDNDNLQKVRAIHALELKVLLPSHKSSTDNSHYIRMVLHCLADILAERSATE